MCWPGLGPGRMHGVTRGNADPALYSMTTCSWDSSSDGEPDVTLARSSAKVRTRVCCSWLIEDDVSTKAVKLETRAPCTVQETKAFDADYRLCIFHKAAHG